MSDPTSEAHARISAAADQFGAAITDAFKLAMRQAMGKQIAEDFGDGPWVLHEDGRVEPYTPRRRPRPARPTRKPS